MHVSEYLKPSALWIYHTEGKFLNERKFEILNNFKYLYPQINCQSYLDNWFKFGFRGFIGKLNTLVFEQVPLAFAYTFSVWHDATKDCSP